MKLWLAAAWRRCEPPPPLRLFRRARPRLVTLALAAMCQRNAPLAALSELSAFAACGALSQYQSCDSE
jgi:hypothetical protein